MRELKLKAIFFGLGAYVFAWAMWNLVGSIFANESDAEVTEAYRFLFHVFNLLAALAPGYIAALIAKSRPIFHGITVGFVLGVIIILFWLFSGVLKSGSLSSVLFMPVFLVIMSGLGSLVANWQLQRKKNGL